MRILQTLKLNDFYPYKKLLRSTAWIVRYVNKLTKKTTAIGPLTPQEITYARLLWDLYI